MGHPRALHMSTASLSSGGQMAHSHRLWGTARCLGVRRACRSAQSAAKAGEEAYPVRLQVYRSGSKLPRANWLPDSRASASYAVPNNSPSSAAHCATSPSSAMLSARHLPQRSVSAASSRRPRRREQRSTVDFIMKSAGEPLLPRAHPYGSVWLGLAAWSKHEKD